MLRRSKINIASCICIAFLFRLLIVNVGLVLTPNAEQISDVVKSRSSNFIKYNNHFEPVNDNKSSAYLVEEMFEEDIEDDDQFKLDAFFITHVFFSIAASKIETQLKNITPFNKHFSCNSSRYLEFGVFRL